MVTGDDSSHSQGQSGKRLLLASRDHPIWSPPYQRSCFDPSYLSDTLNLPPGPKSPFDYYEITKGFLALSREIFYANFLHCIREHFFVQSEGESKRIKRIRNKLWKSLTLKLTSPNFTLVFFLRENPLANFEEDEVLPCCL